MSGTIVAKQQVISMEYRLQMQLPFACNSRLLFHYLCMQLCQVLVYSAQRSRKYKREVEGWTKGTLLLHFLRCPLHLHFGFVSLAQGEC